MSRVMVAMRGGVDSSVAAALLVQQGHEVVGITMKLFGEDLLAEPPVRSCCSAEAVSRARRSAHMLGLRHHTFNLIAEFEERVIAHFCHEYAAGRTPNPCLRCNQLIKWSDLLRRARGVGCAYLATGHYAVVEARNGRYALRRGRDRDKEQSYALCGLTQEQLAHTLLPLGEYSKQQVRSLAGELALPTAQVAESQDICFIPDGDYRSFLRGRVDFQPGPIRDTAGRILGTHQGLPAYTVGQRHGLGVGGGPPRYVVAKDLADNALIVGLRCELARRECELEEVNWVSIPPPVSGEAVEAQIELRYRARPVPGTVTVRGSQTAQLALASHDQAVSPGQAAVFYDGDLLLGGGIISS